MSRYGHRQGLAAAAAAMSPGRRAKVAEAIASRAYSEGLASPYTYGRKDVLFFLVVGLVGGFFVNDMLAEGWARDMRRANATQAASLALCLTAVERTQALSDGLDQCVGTLQRVRDTELTSGWVAP